MIYIQQYDIKENKSKVFYNGSVWDSNNCGKFEILGRTNKFIINKKGWKDFRYYLCKFEDGTVVEVVKDAIKSGSVKNPNYPSVCGIGYIGQGRRNSKHNGRKSREYSIWTDMILRCYSEVFKFKIPSYRDVTVCKRWHSFQNFCDDIQYLNGYEQWKNKNNYQLDKDILCSKLNISPKIYSPETCMFISQKDNVSESTTRKHLATLNLIYTGISPNGEEYDFVNQSEFAREHGLQQQLINKCLKGKLKTHKEWKFKVKEQ